MNDHETHRRMVDHIKARYDWMAPHVVNYSDQKGWNSREFGIDLRVRSDVETYGKIITPKWDPDKEAWITVQTLNVGVIFPILCFARWGDENWRRYSSNSGGKHWAISELNQPGLLQLRALVRSMA